MTVTSVDKDFDNLTLTLIADFPAPVERVWQLWADPRQLERWWGPPTFPATMEVHELRVGGDVKYYMTGPDGEKYHGWWKVDAVDEPNSLEFTDGFADQDGNPADSMPTTKGHVRLSEHEGGTRMEMLSRFESREDMDQLDKMGMSEGLKLAVGQIDALLAA